MLYSKALRQVAVDPYFTVFYWDHAHRGLSNLRNVYTEYASKINIEEDLPIELSHPLSEIQFFLEIFATEIIQQIKSSFTASPPLRPYYSRKDSPDSRPGYICIEQVSYSHIQDTALKCVLFFKRRFEDQGAREYYTMHALLDEFEHLMEDDSRAKTFISPYIASLISQLSVISECLHQFHCFQPWAKKIECYIKEKKVHFGSRYVQIGAGWAKIHMLEKQFEENPMIYKLGNPKNGKFDYPTDEQRTRNSVKKMMAAEEALDLFWKFANTRFIRLCGISPGVLVQHIIGERQLYRTAPWVEPMKAPFVRGEQQLTFSAQPHDITKQITGTFDKLNISSKSKVKTRGIAAVKQNQTISLATEGVVGLLPMIVVDKRALKVFSTLFHSPDNPNQPAECTMEKLPACHDLSRICCRKASWFCMDFHADFHNY